MRIVIVSALAAPVTAAAADGSWQIVHSANANTQDNMLEGIACIDATDCVAVGQYYNSSSTPQTLIEENHGAGWDVVNSPDTGSSQSNILFGVACTGGGGCWAVGYSQVPGTGTAQTLIEQRTPTGWVIVTSPNPVDSIYSSLNAVTCISASDCWAVGYAFIGANYQTLTEQYTGGGWSIVSSPSTLPAQTNYLVGVSCATADDCWAVGYYDNGTTYQTLTEQYTGGGWSIVSSPDPGGSSSQTALLGVECPDSQSCWAVGYTYASTSQPHDLVLHETSGGWTVGASPDPNGSGTAALLAVTCVSSSDCWAIGYFWYAASPGIEQTLILQYTDAGWAIVASPDTSTTQDNYLQGVACSAADSCWAAGWQTVPSMSPQTLILQHASSPQPAVPDMPMPALALVAAAMALGAVPLTRYVRFRA